MLVFFRPTLVCFFLCFILTAFYSSGTSAANPSYRSYAADLLRHKPDAFVPRPELETLLETLANRVRLQNGRAPVRQSARLKDVARAQAFEMARDQFVGHQSASRFSPKERIFSFFSDDVLESFAENAARNRQKGPTYERAAQIIQQWMTSAGHRKNLLNRSYQFVSTGVFEYKNGLYAVQIFWSERPASSQQSGVKFF